MKNFFKSKLLKLRDNWQIVAIVILLFVVVFLVGRNSAPANSQPKAGEQPPAVGMCDVEPVKFDDIKIEGLTVTFTYTLPKNFNSGVDYGDGNNSKYKANVTRNDLVAQDTYTYSRPGKYLVGLFTYDYDLQCDNGAGIYITVP